MTGDYIPTVLTYPSSDIAVYMFIVGNHDDDDTRPGTHLIRVLEDSLAAVSAFRLVMVSAQAFCCSRLE